MHSCLYEGRVRHRRFALVERAFSFPLFMVYVDLAEIETTFGRRGLWSTKWPAVARFRRRDHLGPSEQPLDDSVRELVEGRLGWRPEGPIRLLTHFRYFGVGMNPISLYYCFDAHGTVLQAVVAEVNNTPWGERHCYAIDLRDRGDDEHVLRERSQKQLHVSPFLPMDLEYDWRLTIPGERLTVAIGCESADGRLFSAILSLHRKPLTRARRIWSLIRYPLMTAQVIAGIYWQAFLIRMRGVPFIPHPATLTASSLNRTSLSPN